MALWAADAFIQIIGTSRLCDLDLSVQQALDDQQPDFGPLKQRWRANMISGPVIGYMACQAIARQFDQERVWLVLRHSGGHVIS